MAKWLQDVVRRRLDGLHRVSIGLQHLGEYQDVVQGVVDAVEEHLGFEYGAVLLLNPQTGRLEPRAVSRQGKDDAFVEEDKQYVAARLSGVEKGIAAWVARNGSTIRSGDVRRDPRYLGLREGVRSELCVPLRARNRVLGVFNTETTRRNGYRRSDEKALEILAGELALAIVAEAYEIAVTPGGFVVQCSWCGRVKLTDEVWRDVAPSPLGRRITHGICPECMQSHYPA